MKTDARIKNIYTPVQPAVDQSGEGVVYSEFLPDIRLRKFIFCYWQLKTINTLANSFQYRVAADGCIDIIININNSSDNFVMGFHNKYSEFELDKSFNYFGVRFFPAMFPLIFRIDASELSNRFEKLNTVIPRISNFISDNFGNSLTFEQIKKIMDDYFLNLISKINLDFDNRIYNAIEIIQKNYGSCKVEKELNTGISSRQLRRLFKFYVGDSVKTFCRVIRFQNFLKVRISDQSLNQSKLFFNPGYYDQSHIIKEFKNFYGLTPDKAFRR